MSNIEPIYFWSPGFLAEILPWPTRAELSSISDGFKFLSFGFHWFAAGGPHLYLAIDLQQPAPSYL